VELYWAFKKVFELLFRNFGEVGEVWKGYPVYQLREEAAKVFQVFQAAYGVRTAVGGCVCFGFENKDLIILKIETIEGLVPVRGSFF
jgi:hypothetical protein